MMKKIKTMLIVGSGGLRGAYSGGVLAELCRKLGPDYFDTIIGSSVGAYNATYYVANEPYAIEKIWRNYVDSDKFVDFKNIYEKGKILDLDYLTSVLKNREVKLNTERVLKSRVNLKYVLTDCKTGKAKHFTPEKNNIFDLMKASAAMTPLYPPVKIRGRLYTDGGLAEPLPFRPEYTLKYDKIIVIHNDYKVKQKTVLFFKIFSILESKKLATIIKEYFNNLEKVKKEAIRYKNVFLLQPSKKIPLKSVIDTNKERLNATVDLGIQDAIKVINFLKS